MTTPPALTRRALIAGGAALAGSSPTWAQAIGEEVLTPEMFGAKGDGVTDDSDAMATLAGAVNIRRGGVVRLRRTTYRVGRQSPSTDDRNPFRPASLLAFHGCTRPLRVLGGGARLRCADGLRYGTFHHDGSVLNHPMPYAGPGACSPYDVMVAAVDCTGPVEIADLELDGNVSRLIIGGEYGDSGRQIHALGLALFNNHGPEVIRDIHTHHHAQDGLYIDGLDAEAAGPFRRVISNVVSEDNARQGCSIVGGRGYAFDHCRFDRTGRAGLMSAPGAGVDIEAEGKRIRALSFTACVFADNAGCGVVADTGDTEGVTFTACRFVGTTNWSAWPNKPGMRFRACEFVGALCRAYGDTSDAARAAQFLNCSFRDDPRLSPTGRVYGGTNPGHPLADLSDWRNVLFDRCRFLATHDAVMPWSTGAIYRDCIMQQSSANQGYPRGTFLGRTSIRANVDLYGSRVLGEVDLNGRVFTHTHF